MLTLPIKFQSTHPLRGATSRVGKIKRQDGFQSTHPLRGATGVDVVAQL